MQGNQGNHESQWDEPTLRSKQTGETVRLADVDGGLVNRFLGVEQALYTSPWGDETQLGDVKFRHATAERIWDCAYSFAQCRYWDGRAFEPDPDFLVTEVAVDFEKPVRDLLPGGGGIPLQGSRFYARAFYSTANQALDILYGRPEKFPDIKMLTKKARQKHPIILARNKLVEHPEIDGDEGSNQASFSLLGSVSLGDTSSWGGSGSTSLVADARAFLATFESK